MLMLVMFVLAALASLALPCGAQESVPEAPGGVVAFTHVDVLPMDAERMLTDQVVVVEDGVVRAWGPSGTVAIPDAALRVDGRDRVLMPGLVDAHVHLRAESELLSYLAHGVTTVVHLSGATAEMSDLLALRRGIAEGETVGPTIYSSGPVLDGDPPIFSSASTVVTTAEEASRVVAEQAAAGYEFVKVYNNLEPGVLRAAIAAADRHGMAVFGHVPRRGGRSEALQRALGSGLDVIAHSEEYFFTYFHEGVDEMLDAGRLPSRDPGGIPEVVRLTREAGAAVIPNLSFVAATRWLLDDPEAMWDDSESRHLAPHVREMWRANLPGLRPDVERFDLRERAKQPFVRALTRALHEGDVPLLLGSDASAPGLFPGQSAHLELRELVTCGLTPFEALATGTRNAGRFLQEHTSPERSAVPPAAGVIAVGRRVDLILVRESPLADVSAAAEVEGVLVRGRWLTREALLRMRAQVLERTRDE